MNESASYLFTGKSPHVKANCQGVGMESLGGQTGSGVRMKWQVTDGEDEDRNYDVWIQIHNLPLYLLTEEGARKSMSKVGEVSDFDPQVLFGEYGNYVRICVRLQGTKPLRRGGYIIVLGERIWLDYRYENIPWICEWCGCFVHKLERCAEEKRGRETKSVAGYGPWMLDRSKWMSRKTPSDDGNGEQWKTDRDEPLAANLVVRSEIGEKMVVHSNPFACEVLSEISVDKSTDKRGRISVEKSMAVVVSQPKRMMEVALCLLSQYKQTIRRWEFNGWDPGQQYFEGNTPLLMTNVIIFSNVEERGLFGLLKWELWLMHNTTFFEESSNREEAFTKYAQTLSRWAFKVWDPGRQKVEEEIGFSGLFVWVLWLLRKATFFDGRPKRTDVFVGFDRIMWDVCGTRKLGLEDVAKPLLEDVQRKQMGVGPEDIPIGWDSLLECVDLVFNFEDAIVNWIHREVFSATHQVARNARCFDFSDQWLGRILSWLDDMLLNDVMVPD